MPFTETERDELLARLLADLSDRAHRGEVADIDAAVAEHPDLADELRSLWAAARVADEFARPALTPSALRAAELVQRLTQPPAPPSPSINPSREFCDFELLEELGRGGMGVVYKAWQKNLKRTVALKMILRGDQATQLDQARFKAEAEAAANLHHPNIVSVFGAGECDGQSYFSMRFVEGENLLDTWREDRSGHVRPLDSWLSLAGPCSMPTTAGFSIAISSPSNVLIGKDGQPYVTDFGLAKRVAAPEGIPVEALTQSGAILGTPAYMAPEQVSGSRGRVGPSSDVYSLGVILYELLTGRPPFQAATPVDTLLLVLDQDPVRPRMLNPSVDPDLELICLKCIQKEPSIRYASAAELAGDLEAFLNGDQLSVRSLGFKALGTLFSNAMRETHYAPVLENWGVLWMWHSLTVFLICCLTAWMKWAGVNNPSWYLVLWGGGLVVWGATFWKLRKRGGPVLFVERQVAHVWAGGVIATVSVFVAEVLLGLDVLTLSPILAVIAGLLFVVKAGMLSGEFYLAAAAEFLIAAPMALVARNGYPWCGPLLFGTVTAICFFVPGLKYHRQRLRSLRARATNSRDSVQTST